MYREDECVNNAEAIEADSPFIDKLRQYIDLERSIERGQVEVHRLEKRMAESAEKMAAIRRELTSYLDVAVSA